MLGTLENWVVILFHFTMFAATLIRGAQMVGDSTRRGAIDTQGATAGLAVQLEGSVRRVARLSANRSTSVQTVQVALTIARKSMMLPRSSINRVALLPSRYTRADALNPTIAVRRFGLTRMGRGNEPRTVLSELMSSSRTAVPVFNSRSRGPTLITPIASPNSSRSMCP